MRRKKEKSAQKERGRKVGRRMREGGIERRKEEEDWRVGQEAGTLLDPRDRGFQKEEILVTEYSLPVKVALRPLPVLVYLILPFGIQGGEMAPISTEMLGLTVQKG